jgi:hypothetical protein
MESILLALSPIIVTGLTQLAKRLIPLVASINSIYLRIGVALLSFVIALANGALTGDLNVTSIQTLADTLVTFLGATGAYILAKRNS